MLLYLSFKFSPNQNNSYGPLLYMTERYNSTNYYFDGHTENLRPTHDPLGGNSPNQKKNVANPYYQTCITLCKKCKKQTAKCWFERVD